MFPPSKKTIKQHANKGCTVLLVIKKNVVFIFRMYYLPREDTSTLIFKCYTWDAKILIGGSIHQAFENISHVCRNINISYDDRIDYLMQFSFYISLKSDLLLHTSYVSAGIDSDEVALSGYQAAIHYTAMYNVHKFSKFWILLDINKVSDVRMGFGSITYYLSFSKTLLCQQKFNNNFEIFYQRKLVQYFLYIKYSLLFRSPYSYFKLMNSEILIGSYDFPPCDVVVNFQVVTTRTTDKSQESCNTGFLQVSFL